MTTRDCDPSLPSSSCGNKGKEKAKPKKLHYVIKVLLQRDAPGSFAQAPFVAPSPSPSLVATTIPFVVVASTKFPSSLVATTPSPTNTTTQQSQTQCLQDPPSQ